MTTIIQPKQSVSFTAYRAAIIALAVLALVVTAYFAGRQASNTEWHTGDAFVGIAVASIEADGWTYGFRDSVSWIGQEGTVHDSEWPECLPQGSVSDVRFAAVDVDVDGMQWREVVAVDCSLGG